MPEQRGTEVLSPWWGYAVSSPWRRHFLDWSGSQDLQRRSLDPGATPESIRRDAVHPRGYPGWTVNIFDCQGGTLENGEILDAARIWAGLLGQVSEKTIGSKPHCLPRVSRWRSICWSSWRHCFAGPAALSTSGVVGSLSHRSRGIAVRIQAGWHVWTRGQL